MSNIVDMMGHFKDYFQPTKKVVKAVPGWDKINICLKNIEVDSSPQCVQDTAFLLRQLRVDIDRKDLVLDAVRTMCGSLVHLMAIQDKSESDLSIDKAIIKMALENELLELIKNCSRVQEAILAYDTGEYD